MKKESKTTIKLDEESIKNIFSGYLNLPEDANFSFNIELIETKHDKGDFRDPPTYTYKGKFKNLTITYKNK